MRMMKRFSLATAAFLTALVALAPASASAQIVELGKTVTPLSAPSCAGVPATQCLIILTRTTAIETVSDSVVYPTKVKQAGWIVAFTVGLSQLSSTPKVERGFLHTLDVGFGGPPQLALTVLQPGPGNKFTVVAQSGMYHLIPFLGQVLQEPLSLPPTFTTFTSLPVKPGDVIGLTVPTWAPVLSYGLSTTKFAYRQSRMANCHHPAGGQTAQTTIGASQRYLCNFTGTRVEYSATEVVNQAYPKTYVHRTRRP
jgi:hypothetical protein